jgi:hypothetical protein
MTAVLQFEFDKWRTGMTKRKGDKIKNLSVEIVKMLKDEELPMALSALTLAMAGIAIGTYPGCDREALARKCDETFRMTMAALDAGSGIP